jgi:hypothetical protein
MERFDITMTATLRPELIERTLESHQKYLFKTDMRRARLIINVDFVGVEESCHSRTFDKVLRVIDKFPFCEIVFRPGVEPHFGKAFCWCMEQIAHPFVFHLEEDWEMQFELDFREMYELFGKYPNLAHLRLSSFISTLQTCKNWNKFLVWNGDFFEVEFSDRGVIGWCGHPSLNRSSFIKDVMAYVKPESNPEKQIKGRRYRHPLNNIFASNRFGSYHPQNSPKAVIDIGRQWMVEKGYVKQGNKAFFTQWERSKN